MRLVGVLVLAAAVGLGGFLFSTLVARGPMPLAARSQVLPRNHYRLTRDTPTLRLRLDPGASLIKLKLRAEAIPAPTTTTVSLQVLDADDLPFTSAVQLPLTLSPQDAAERTAWLANDDTTPSLSTSRVLRVEAGPYGGSLTITTHEQSPVLLVRAFVGGEHLAKGGAGKGHWYRIAAQNLGASTPSIITVMTEPASEGDDDDEAPGETPPAVSSAAWRSRMFLLARGEEEPRVRLPLPESLGGMLRITVRLLGDETTSELLGGFDYRLFSEAGEVASGEVRETTLIDPAAAFADPAARSRAEAALTARGLPLPAELRASRPIVGYVPYPARASRIELETLSDVAALTYVSLATWAGPSGGVGLEGTFAPPDAPRWQLLVPENAAALSFAGRTTIFAVSPAVESPAPPPAAAFEQLSASLATPNEILEAVPAGAPPGSLSRVGAAGIRLCAGPSQKPVSLRLRVADPRRLGSSVRARIGPSRVATLTLLTTALTYRLDNLPPDCVDLRLEGLEADDLALVEAAAVPGAPTWARRRVFQVEPGASLRFPVDLHGAELASVHAYPTAGAHLTLRVAVDDMAPRRNEGTAARRASPAVVQATLIGVAAPDLLLSTEPRVRLGEATRLSVPLGDDLLPGRHELVVTAVGRGRVWVRASTRNRDLPLEAPGARPE